MSTTSRLQIQQTPSHDAPMDLLREADPSESKIRQYLPSSSCYVAEESGSIVGVYVLTPLNNVVLELMNIAVTPGQQRKGIGSTLLKHAITTAKELGAKRLEVGTGTFGFQLGFYQKAGFRVFEIDRDFFLKNYDEPIFESGIQLKDMIRLAIDFNGDDPLTGDTLTHGK